MYSSKIKRILDLVCACIIFFPVWLIILCVALASIVAHRSWKVFFTQTRIGRDCKPFKIIKIRSMSNRKDKEGLLLPDQKRVTPFGLFLRRTSLDELPQIINIIKGDMSLVGPRPFTPEDCAKYCSEKQMEIRHKVRPGLTGLAQVYGRNSIDFEYRIRYDLFYVNHVSFYLDMQIIFRTANVVLE